MRILVKIFSPASLIISIIILFYLSREYQLNHNYESKSFYKIHIYIFLIFLIFSLTSFFFSKKIKTYLIITFVYTIFVFYTFETYLIFLKFNFLNKSELRYEHSVNTKYDTRTKLEAYKDLKKIEATAAVPVPPHSYYNENTALYPLSGVSNVKTLFCNENGYYFNYSSDRYGFNNPNEEWNSKEIEYFLIGDSLTHGACVNRPNDIASILRSVSKKKVLNLGYAGNGSLVEFATLREFLRPNVKKVFWIYSEANDLEELVKELNSSILKKYLSNLEFSQNLLKKQNDVNIMNLKKINEEIIKLEKNFQSEILRFLKLSNFRNFIFFLSKKENVQKIKVPDEFGSILQLAKDLVLKNRSEFYFVYLPEYNRYKDKNYNNSNFLKIRNIINKLNIPFIDIDKEIFQKEENPLDLFPFKKFGHYNTKGYKLIAEFLYSF